MTPEQLFTALAAGPPYSPDAQASILETIFGAKPIAISQVPKIYNDLRSTLAAISANVAAATASAIGNYRSFLAANPSLLLAPLTTPGPTWASFHAIVGAVNNEPVTSAVINFMNAIEAWYQNNVGSLKPATAPTVPDVLVPYLPK